MLHIFREIHFVDFHSSVVNPRPMDPSKDLAAYGFGSVTWKERMESWKNRQEKLQVMRTDERQALSGGKGGDDYDDPDLPVYVSYLKCIGSIAFFCRDLFCSM